MLREFRGPVVVTVALAGVLLLLIASYGQWHLRPSEGIAAEIADSLRSLGLRALASNDVPVAAVVLYGDEIIGKGHNTVHRDSSAGGHAEIEAISGALARVGVEGFKRLNRDSLVLITTFEPCLMCRGAILEYNIKEVIFLKGKPVLHWLREDLRSFRYSWTRKQGGDETLQDSLFRQHPLYPQ